MAARRTVLVIPPRERVVRFVLGFGDTLYSRVQQLLLHALQGGISENGKSAGK